MKIGRRVTNGHSPSTDQNSQYLFAIYLEPLHTQNQSTSVFPKTFTASSSSPNDSLKVYLVVFENAEKLVDAEFSFLSSR